MNEIQKKKILIKIKGQACLWVSKIVIKIRQTESRRFSSFHPAFVNSKQEISDFEQEIHSLVLWLRNLYGNHRV
jgi:hypothetical protein